MRRLPRCIELPAVAAAATGLLLGGYALRGHRDNDYEAALRQQISASSSPNASLPPSTSGPGSNAAKSNTSSARQAKMKRALQPVGGDYDRAAAAVLAVYNGDAENIPRPQQDETTASSTSSVILAQVKTAQTLSGDIRNSKIRSEVEGIIAAEITDQAAGYGSSFTAGELLQYIPPGQEGQGTSNHPRRAGRRSR